MRLFAYLLPVVTAIILFATKFNADIWWVFLLFLGVPLLILWIVELLFKHLNDVEFLSAYVVSVAHYNEWVERVERTETISDEKGNVRTKTYIDYVTHPEYWEQTFNTGKRQFINYSEYEELCNLFGTPIQHFDTYYFNCVSGGGGQECHWDYNEMHTKTLTFSHRYRNYMRYSNSVMRFREVTPQDVKDKHLFDYPKPPKYYDQKVVLEQPDVDLVTADAQEAFQRLNAFCGERHEIHVFVLLFDATKQGVEAAELQRAYWEGGNQNEFVVCIGVDKDGTVKWSDAFSWMDVPTLSVATRQYLTQNPKLDLVALAQWIRDNLDKWKRKNFEDFKYLGTNFSPAQEKWFVTISVLLCAVAVTLAIMYV